MPSLLEVCAFCFEKNEILQGWGARVVPYPTDALALDAFASLVAEAERLLGPATVIREAPRARARWPRLRIAVSGRLVQVLVAAPPVIVLRPPDEAWQVDEADWAALFEERDGAPDEVEP